MAYKQEPKSPALKRCWEGYSPVPGKKKEEKGSCAKSPAKIAPLLAMAGKAIIGSLVSKAVDKASPAKRTKPYKAGMSAAERKTYNNKTGGNLKAPQPGGGERKENYCARSAGIKKCKDPDKNGDCPNDIARRNWKC